MCSKCGKLLADLRQLKEDFDVSVALANELLRINKQLKTENLRILGLPPLLSDKSNTGINDG